MRVVTLEQGTKEWFALRRGCVTASNANRVLGGKVAIDTYVYELIANLTTSYSKEVDTGSIRWGHEYEEEAIGSLEMTLDKEIKKVGFALHADYDGAGCSLDGFYDDCIVEIKCPFNPGNHVRHIIEGFEKKYIQQVQFQMWISGFRKAKLVSYDPRFERRLFYKDVKYDDKIGEMLDTRVPEIIDRVERGVLLINRG